LEIVKVEKCPVNKGGSPDPWSVVTQIVRYQSSFLNHESNMCQQ